MSKVHLSIRTIFGRPKGGRIRQVSLYLILLRGRRVEPGNV